MTPEDLLARIRDSTAAAGMDPRYASLRGGQALVARTTEFRWSWMATRMHAFVVATPFAAELARPPALDQYMDDALDYAVTHKDGLPRGLQTGSGAVVVAVTAGADESARQWAASPHGRRFAAMPFPVLADVASGRVDFPRRMVIGGIYRSYFQQLVEEHVMRFLVPAPWR
jgi:hypothetical protein